MNAVPHKGFPWIWYLLALLVIVAFAFAPDRIGHVMRRDRKCERVQS